MLQCMSPRPGKMFYLERAGNAAAPANVVWGMPAHNEHPRAPLNFALSNAAAESIEVLHVFRGSMLEHGA